MFEERHIPNKKLDECIIVFVRPHWMHIVSALLLFVILTLLPVGMYYVMGDLYMNFFTGNMSYVLLVLLGGIYYLSALLIFFNSFLDRELDIWVVTNHRIIAIEQRGLFNRVIAEHYIERIQDVSATQKGVLQTILNYGDVQIQTSGEQQKFIFNDVYKPVEIQGKINDLLGKKLKET